MVSYTFLLPNDKARSFRFITFFLLLLNGTFFGMIFFTTPDQRTHELSRFGFLLSLTYIIIYFVKQYSKFLSRYKLEISFIVLGILWLVLGKFAIAGILFFCAVSGLYLSKKPEVIFTNENISYPSFPVKKILWNEVANVILKDDVLTIDLKNNKLMQHTVVPVSGVSVNEQEFNAFCTGNITTAVKPVLS